MSGQQTQFKAEFEAIFNSITDAIVFTDAKRQIVLVNPAFTKTFGYHLEEVSGRTTQIIYANPESYFNQGKTRYNETTLNSKTVYENEYRRKDGTLFPGETLGTQVKGENGELLGFLGAIRDLTERIETHKKLQDKIKEYELSQKLLKESEERFRALHDASLGGVIIHDGGLILDCNQGLSDITGFTNEELVGMDGLKLIAPDFLEIAIKKIKAGYSEKYEVEGVRKDGSTYPLSIRGKNISYKGRKARVITFQDITKEKQVENALREREEYFRNAFETNPDPVILAKLEDGSIIDVNTAFVQATGITRLEAVGHNSEQLNLWQDKGLRETFREQLQTHGEIKNLEADFNAVGGQVRTALVSARLITIKEEPCILITTRDITTEKEAERALIEMDQMKSDFISIAAHELRTPLTAIIGYTELILNTVGHTNQLSEEKKRDFLHEILSRGDALNRIIDDVLNVSRIESGQPLPLDLQKTSPLDLIDKTIEFYQLHDSRHCFRLELSDEIKETKLFIDRQRICQVLENLLSNAVKYSPKGSEIVLTGSLQPEGWQIAISDQGIGMSQEQLNRIFDKFYRANASSNLAPGLGLGMSIVKHIIEAHGGKIRVDSTEGVGTTVTFNLPNPAA